LSRAVKEVETCIEDLEELVCACLGLVIVTYDSDWPVGVGSVDRALRLVNIRGDGPLVRHGGACREYPTYCKANLEGAKS
jgi:hypothetical protein